jgi:predicted DNA-binding protein with PD1-like motif
VLVVKVGEGAEVIETITNEVARRGITDAAVVSVIGAVEGAVISVMPKGDPTSDILTSYPEPLELSGTGEVTDGRVHLHVTAGGESGTVTGHLHEAHVQHWFVHAYIIAL